MAVSMQAWRGISPGAWRDLGDMLASQAERLSDRPLFEFHEHRATTAESLTYGELHEEAGFIAGHLRRAGCRPGEPVLLIYPAGLEFVAAFFGCVYAGLTPAPVALSLLPEPVRKIASVLKSSGARLVLGNSAHLSRLKAAISASVDTEGVRWVATDLIDPGPLVDPAPGGEIAFLQYSSGSTGDPKGVQVGHANVLHNLSLLQSAFRSGEDDVSVSWLPHHHDMGLIAGLLHTIYSGGRAVLMPPLTFFLRPAAWLTAISQARAAFSAAPNFAYEHCVATVSDEAKAHLDLRSWCVAVSGAEPIRADTIDRFAEAFEPCGFRRQAFFPSYGLAEATLMVSGGERGEGPTFLRADAGALEAGRLVSADASQTGAARTLVACGRPKTTVLVAEPQTLRGCAEGEIGEILVAGDSVASGYRNDAAGSGQVFNIRVDCEDRVFLRTGDLGAMLGGQLYVTGRLKDLIIVRGRNLHPHDIEATVQGCDGRLRPGGGAAFPIDMGQGEGLVVVQEMDAENGLADVEQLLERIRRAIETAHELTPQHILLTRPGATPKTSSGKVRRSECKTRFLAGELARTASWEPGARET